MFAPFGSIQAAQITRLSNFWKPLDTMKIKLCKCTVQSAGTGGRVGKQVRNPVNEKRLEVQNGSFATRKFLSIFYTCVERMEIEWAKDISNNE